MEEGETYEEEEEGARAEEGEWIQAGNVGLKEEEENATPMHREEEDEGGELRDEAKSGTAGVEIRLS